MEHIASMHQFQCTKCLQHQQTREKVTCNPQIHCVRKSSKILQQSGDARNRRAREPTFLRNGTSGYPKKSNVSCKSQHSNGIHDAVAMWSAQNDLQNTIRIVTSLLYSSLPYSTFLNSTLFNLYSTATSTCTPAPLLLSSALLYNLLYSTLLSSILYSTIFRSLPLLHLYAGADWTQWYLG